MDSEPAQRDDRPLVPGSRLGGYRITESLGHGAMGEVLLAQDETGHEVAIKVFRETTGVSSTLLERFRREAEATKKLRRHPYILTVYATGRQAPWHYIVMEYIKERNTFEDYIELDNPSEEEVLRIGIKIASALEYAHDHGIIHRDVKPANVLIDGFGEPLLADFGVAELSDWPSCTISGALTGTPMYMSPEQARAERASPASDVYSLCVMMYEALTGDLPYELSQGPLTKDVLEAVKHQRPVRARHRKRSLSRDIDYVLHRGLAKDPDERYPTMRALITDIEAALNQRPIAGRIFSPVIRSGWFVRRHRIALLLLLALGLAVAGVANQRQKDHRNARARDLLQIARQIDLKYRLVAASNQAGASRLDLESEYNSARKDMENGKYDAARESFQAIALLSRKRLEWRQALAAQRDQARCEALLGRRTQALILLREVAYHESVSPTAQDIALFDIVALTLIDQDLAFGGAPLPDLDPETHQGPLAELTLFMLGYEARSDFLIRLDDLPESFQNDAELALAIQAYLDDDITSARKHLMHCIEKGHAMPEWPTPLAKQLLEDPKWSAP